MGLTDKLILEAAKAAAKRITSAQAAKVARETVGRAPHGTAGARVRNTVPKTAAPGSKSGPVIRNKPDTWQGPKAVKKAAQAERNKRIREGVSPELVAKPKPKSTKVQLTKRIPTREEVEGAKKVVKMGNKKITLTPGQVTALRKAESKGQLSKFEDILPGAGKAREPRPAGLTDKEIEILRQVGKRDYSVGEINPLARKIVDQEADRRINEVFKKMGKKLDIEDEARFRAALEQLKKEK